MSKKEKALREAMIADLERSGIGEEHLKELQFAPRDNNATKKALKLGWRCDATTYEIPYFSPDGKRTQFNRYRLLDGSWNSADSKAKSFKYNQKFGTLPHLYFPPIVEWPIEDERIKLDYLCITEGEKKAIKACLVGIPCVALGGVYSFGAKKKQINLLDEFDLFDLTDTQIEICFDSDVHSNADVRAALNKLASELTPHTSKPIRYVMLDAESSDKTGLDDYLCQFPNNKKAEKAFWSLPRREDKRSAAIADFDAQIVYVAYSNRFYHLRDRRWYRNKGDVFDEHENLPKVPHPDDPTKHVSRIKLWFEQRKPETTVERVVYEPGKPDRYPGVTADLINLWRPGTVNPVSGTPHEWLELFNYLTDTLTADQRQWFMQWLAYPIQHLGSKLAQAVFIHSHAEGIGKNFLFDPFIRNIYGEDNYIRVEGDVLEDGFNGWLAGKQFVFIDEVHISTKMERKVVMNRLKSYTTNKDISVNEKFSPRQQMKNCAQIAMASNHQDGLQLSSKDRRNFIIQGPDKPMPDSFYHAIGKFALSKDGVGKVLHYLHEVNLDGFNPNGKAMFTAAKGNAIKSSQELAEYFIDMLKHSPMEIFGIKGKRPDKDLFTTQEIVSAINTTASGMGIRFATTPISIGKFLVQRQVVSKRIKYRVKHAVNSITLYAIFNPDKWKEKPKETWLIHLRNRDPKYAKTEVALARGSTEERHHGE